MSSALSIRQLTKTYSNGFQALKGIDLDVLQRQLAEQCGVANVLFHLHL